MQRLVILTEILQERRKEMSGRLAYREYLQRYLISILLNTSL